MACPQWIERVLDHLYGEAEPSQAAKIEAHLARCAACRDAVEQLRVARRALQEAAPELPATPRVLVLPEPHRPRWLGLAAAALGAAALFAAGFAVGSQGRDLRGTGAAADSLARLERLEREIEAQRRLLEQWRAAWPGEAGLSQGALTSEDLEQALAALTRDLEAQRRQDLEAMMRAIRAVEQRAGATQDWLEYLLVASDPRALPR